MTDEEIGKLIFDRLDYKRRLEGFLPKLNQLVRWGTFCIIYYFALGVLIGALIF